MIMDYCNINPGSPELVMKIPGTIDNLITGGFNHHKRSINKNLEVLQGLSDFQK